MKLKIFISALFLVALQKPLLAQTAPTRGIAFLPFNDNSDFSGTWNISVEVPRFLSAYVRSQYDIFIVSSPVAAAYREELTPLPDYDDVKLWLQMRKRFGVRYMVIGTVDRFNVSRFSTGTPELASYEAFKGEIAFSYEVIDLERLEKNGDSVPLSKGSATGEFADRALALTLMGRPSTRTVEFRDLNTIQFGSDDFNRTVIGRATFDAARLFMDDLASRIPSLFAVKGMGSLPSGVADSSEITFNVRLLKGKIVFLEGDDAFIDLGTDDGVRTGQTIPVYAANADTLGSLPVGSLKVIQLRGPHLSLTRIVSGKDSITTKHSVRVQILD